MLSVKQGGIKYHFLSLWYDSTWDWTQVSLAIGEHYPNVSTDASSIVGCFKNLSIHVLYHLFRILQLFKRNILRRYLF